MLELQVIVGVASKLAMQPYTDFSVVLQEGYAFQFNMPDEEPQDVTFSIHKLGDLVLTSGRIVACDPLMETNPHNYFSQTVEPGLYPVLVGVANFTPRRDKRFAWSMVRLHESKAVRWQNAAGVYSRPLKQNEMYGYGVDSGTGCFMDVDAAQILKIILEKPIAQEEYDSTLCNELLNNLIHAEYSSTSWADICISELLHSIVHEYYPDVVWPELDASNTTKANIIAFSSGWGDGGYPSFWGYDASDQLVSLITDFGLFAI